MDKKGKLKIGFTNRLSQSLLTRALGYELEEVREEYVQVDGEMKLVGRKVLKKNMPPDINAVKYVLELSKNIDCAEDKVTRAELERERDELQREFRELTAWEEATAHGGNGKAENSETSGTKDRDTVDGKASGVGNNGTAPEEINGTGNGSAVDGETSGTKNNESGESCGRNGAEGEDGTGGRREREEGANIEEWDEEDWYGEEGDDKRLLAESDRVLRILEEEMNERKRIDKEEKRKSRKTDAEMDALAEIMGRKLWHW